MKIIFTNWVNLLGVFVAVYLYSFIVTWNYCPSFNVFQALLSASISVCLYGCLFWGLFVLSLLFLDVLLITGDSKNLKTKLFLEWMVISTPFNYWMIKYNVWVFFVGIVAFLVTQILRRTLIARLLNK